MSKTQADSQWKLSLASCDPAILRRAILAVVADYEVRNGWDATACRWLINQPAQRHQLIEDVKRQWSRFARRHRGHFPYEDHFVTYLWLVFHKQPVEETAGNSSTDASSPPSDVQGERNAIKQSIAV